MKESESIWLERSQKGDPQAFMHLIDTYQQPVYNLCYRMLHNSRDAEDAAQETFLRAFKFLHRYNSKRPFATWLLSIAAHYCIDQLRKRRIQIVSVEELPSVDLQENALGPEARISRKEEQKKIRNLLSGLNPVDRAAIVMYYWYDYSYEEIGETLSLSQSAIKSRLHRARKAMAQDWMEKQSQQIPLAERKCHESPAI